MSVAVSRQRESRFSMPDAALCVGPLARPPRSAAAPRRRAPRRRRARTPDDAKNGIAGEQECFLAAKGQTLYFRSTQMSAIVKNDAAAATKVASRPPVPAEIACQALIAATALNAIAAMFWIRMSR